MWYFIASPWLDLVVRPIQLFTGKTLILEAATKTLSEKDDTELVFILALGKSKDNWLKFEINKHFERSCL